MSITILGKKYEIETTIILDLRWFKLSSLPVEIGNLVNLKVLHLDNNKLTSLLAEILNIKKSLIIDETSYEINNLSLDTEILIFNKLSIELTNLPITLKEIWLNGGININLIKIPFGCEIKYF